MKEESCVDARRLTEVVEEVDDVWCVDVSVERESEGDCRLMMVVLGVLEEVECLWRFGWRLVRSLAAYTAVSQSLRLLDGQVVMTDSVYRRRCWSSCRRCNGSSDRCVLIFARRVSASLTRRPSAPCLWTVSFQKLHNWWTKSKRCLTRLVAKDDEVRREPMSR